MTDVHSKYMFCIFDYVPVYILEKTTMLQKVKFEDVLACLTIATPLLVCLSDFNYENGELRKRPQRELINYVDGTVVSLTGAQQLTKSSGAFTGNESVKISSSVVVTAKDTLGNQYSIHLVDEGSDIGENRAGYQYAPLAEGPATISGLANILTPGMQIRFPTSCKYRLGKQVDLFDQNYVGNVDVDSITIVSRPKI